MATHVRSRGVQTQPSAALRLKCGRERRKLEAKLEDQLCRDLSRCFEESLHPDVILVTPEGEIPIHRAILCSRTPFLCRELNLENSCENHRIQVSNVSCQLLKSLLRKIYCENSVDEEEATLVALLRQDRAKFLQSEETDSDNLQQSSGASSPYKMEAAETDGEGNDLCLGSSQNNNEGEKGMGKTRLQKFGFGQHIATENGHDSDVSTSTPTASENIHDICAGTDFVHVVENATSKETTNHVMGNGVTTNGDDKGDHSGVESESSDDKSRTLIRRDTFDLIDPAIAEDDTQKEDDDEDEDEEELVIIKMDDVNPRVVWEVGGETLKKEKRNYNETNNKSCDDNDDVMIASTQAVSSGSDHYPLSSEITTKDDTLNGMSVSISTEAGGVSLSNSFTATMYDAADNDNHVLDILQRGEQAEISKEFCTGLTDAATDIKSNLNQSMWDQDQMVLSQQNDKNSERPKPDEIIYLDQLSPFVDKKSLSLDCSNTALKRRSNTVDSLVDLHANYESSMKHSNSKLFSPDSIISDRSPMLEKASCFTHSTVQILPILTDYETVGETSDAPNRCPVKPKKYSLSRRSSESLSPEADSLTLETTLHNGLALTASPVANINPLLNGILQPRTPSADKLGAHLEALESRSAVSSAKCRKAKSDAMISKSLESVPIVSGFSDACFAKSTEENRASDTQSSKGSFFVFIDVSDGSKKTLEPPKTRDCYRRKTSGTSEDESLSVNKSLSLDTSRKDSASEDDTHSERSPKLGTSPKAPPSVYMFIEAGTSPKDAPSARRSHHVRRASMSDYSSSPTTRGHIRRLSQGREFVVPPPQTSSADEQEKPRNIKIQETKIEKRNEPLQSPDPEDDIETIYSEFSDYVGHERTSSVSGISPDDDEGRVPCSKLGEDLLRMFLEEINTDVVVRVSGRDIKAHKCILASRCSYFAAMLSGGWLESSGNIINLQGFTYLAVHFALCHIYSGATSIPKEVDISELASLADMLGLEGLRDVVALTLKAKYCHFFHKPCSSCITGVLECLPLCANYGLEELYDKSIRWLTRHMARTWPNKAFASLPDELLNKCYRAAKAEISVQSVLDMIMTCDKLMATLPHVKWSEPVFNLCTKLLEACTVFMAKNLHMVLTSKSFLALGKGQSWNVNALEDTIMMALDNLTPDSACSSYVTLAQLLGSGEYSIDAEDSEVIENFVELLQKIQRQVERYLIHNANRVVHCPSWAKLTPAMQKRIKDAAVIVFEFGKPTAPPPRLSSLNRRFNRGKTHSPAEHSESSTTSSSSGRTTGSKKPARSAAMPIPKPSNRPLTAPLSGTPSSLHSKQSGARKLPLDLPQRCLTPNRDAARRSPASAIMEHSNGGLANSLSPRTSNRLSDLPGAQLRKSASRDRVANARPKSWPNKDKMVLHPVKTKVETSKESAKLSSVTLRTTSRPPPKTGTNSRPRSAAYSSETSSENTAKPCRTFTSSSLRETKSSASKRIAATSDTTDSPNRTKLVDKQSRSHSSTVKKSHTREDSKLHTTRRTTERSGIKVSVGNKG